jgi:hypothetical protein
VDVRQQLSQQADALGSLQMGAVALKGDVLSLSGSVSKLQISASNSDRRLAALESAVLTLENSYATPSPASGHRLFVPAQGPQTFAYSSPMPRIDVKNNARLFSERENGMPEHGV